MRFSLFVLAASLMFSLPAVEKGPTIFSDDFNRVGTFAENWQSRPGVRAEDGLVRLFGAPLTWRQNPPSEYVAEADVRVCPNAKFKPNDWFGFMLGGARFQIQAKGDAFLIAYGEISYSKLASYKLSEWTHLTLEKKRTGDMVKYAFFVNGHLVRRFVSSKPDDRSPISFLGNVAFELDNFVLSRVRHDNDSNNLAFNGGFEHDEDGVPIYYNWLGDFDWTRPVAEYETDFITRYAADRKVKHSGRQSLRVTLAPSCTYNSFWPWQVGGVEERPGVMSVWAKTDVPRGIDVELYYGQSRRKLRVQGDWSRYEVCVTNLSAKSTYSRGGIVIRNPQRIRGHVWFDDLQAETVALPKDGRFDPNKSYATVFRPSELDNGRLDRPLPPTPARSKPDFRHPASYRPGVLGRLDYYMAEKEAAWRVTDENGRATIVTKPLSEIPMGTNMVSFTANGKTYTDTVVRLPFKKGVTQVNRWTRSLVHDGTNELFVGLCLQPVGIPQDTDGRDYPGMFDLLKGKGFRHYQVLTCLQKQKKYLFPGVAKTRICLDEGAKRGFLLLNWWDARPLCGEVGGNPKDPNAMNMRETVVFFNRYDNILSHLVLDEPDLAQKSERTEAQLIWAKSFYPYMPVQMNNSILGVPRRHGNLRTDVLMIDDYLTNAEGRDVAGVLANLDVLLWADDAKPCGFFLVGDNMTLHYRSPTYAEQVAQSWGVLCSGGTIVSWFIGFPNLAGSWRAMVDVNREAQSLASVLLSEELSDQSFCSVGWNGVRHLTRQYKGDWYVCSVNIYVGALEKVTFTLPEGAPKSGTVEVLFENRTLPLENGSFADSYRGHARHIYRIR